MLNEVLALASAHWAMILVVGSIAWLLGNHFNRRLDRYPGPKLAGLSNWWRLWKVYRGDFEYTNIQLHRQYGDVVRVGPNVVSFADPRAIKIIYGLNKGYVKSDFYPIQTAIAKGRPLPSMFSTTDETYHARYRRCVNNAFAMSSLQSYEPLVSSTLENFLRQTQKLFVDSDKICDFGTWLQYFSFDVVGEITWSRRLGFIDQNQDIQGIISSTKSFMDYAALVGQMPLLDRLMMKNPFKLALERWGWIKKVFPVTAFALAREAERVSHGGMALESSKTHDGPPTQGVDLLTKFKQAQKDHPEFMTDTQVLASACSMIFAGSDTTAISLSAIFYYLTHNPRVYTKLLAELDTAAAEGRISNDPNWPTVSWSESQTLPYLDAVIMEGLRLHPAIGLVLERVVPPGGVDILGHSVPAGTIVGCNPWVIHRSSEVFGDEVDEFYPERWIEASEEQLKTMKATMFQFGGGSRTCLGKNIALLEIYKLVPTFLRNFEIELAHPNSRWRTKNSWFVKQYGFETRFRPREGLRAR